MSSAKQALFLLMLALGVGLLVACSRRAPAAEPAPALVLETPPTAAAALLEELRAAEIPPRDPRELAERLGGAPPVALVARDVAPEEPAGSSAQFWYKDRYTDENVSVRARLAYRSDQLNLWVEEAARVDDGDLTAAARIIENDIIPSNRSFFGTEWQPGIDGDPRLNILYLANIGPYVGGYFSSADQTVTAVNPFSNQREMLYIDLENAPLDGDAHYSVIAHEFQHLIHAHTDQNEEVWLEEGLSELAAYLVNYPTPRRAEGAAEMPDIQLNHLSQQPEVAPAHYGAAFLFATYFYEQFGPEATRALVRNPANGISGIDVVLAEMGTEQSFEQVFKTWTAANYLSGAGLAAGGDDRYAYRTVEIPEMALAADHRRLPVSEAATVSQFGADYIRVRADEPVTVVFTGTRQVSLLPTAPPAGDHFWSTIPADRSAMRLTGRFDLTNLERATLAFQTWYDIEEGWDYGYVAVSDDDGETWELLELPGMTRENPQGNSYGPAFTGRSGGGEAPRWVEVDGDLTPYAGQEILLRFEYVTDDAVQEAGWAIDQIAIPELDLLDGAETDDPRWKMAGFARHANVLPQHFSVQVVRIQRGLLGGDSAHTVEPLLLDDAQQGRWTIPLDDDFDEAILIVSGTTPVTRAAAGYAYRITP